MDFEDAGFEMVAGVLAPGEVAALLPLLEGLGLPPRRGGIRRIERKVPEVAALAHSSRLLEEAGRHLSGVPRLVRAIYFVKSPEANWFVTWHQDRTVAVSRRFEAEGWGPWSFKEGAWHVQPPLEVLEDMVTLRLHLDPATAANGCLKVLPGSHRAGLLAPEQIRGCVSAGKPVFCAGPTGGAVVMRPHILHASEKAVAPEPRRVLHFEYSSYALPDGIGWSD